MTLNIACLTSCLDLGQNEVLVPSEGFLYHHLIRGTEDRISLNYIKHLVWLLPLLPLQIRQ